jgi:hypothetical protein
MATEVLHNCSDPEPYNPLVDRLVVVDEPWGCNPPEEKVQV